MTDLPEEMIRATVYGNQEDSIRLLEAGAKEIKRLRKTLEQISALTFDCYLDDAKEIARQALKRENA